MQIINYLTFKFQPSIAHFLFPIGFSVFVVDSINLIITTKFIIFNSHSNYHYPFSNVKLNHLTLESLSINHPFLQYISKIYKTLSLNFSSVLIKQLLAIKDHPSNSNFESTIPQ